MKGAETKRHEGEREMAGDKTQPNGGDERRREQLAMLRRLAGFSQESLAEDIGVSRSSTYRWERGESVPNPSQLVRWAKAIDVPVAELDDLLWSGDTRVRSVDRDEPSAPPSADEASLDAGDGHPTVGDPASAASPDIVADLIDPPGFNPDLHHDFASAVATVLGVGSRSPDDDGVRVAMVLPTFGGRSIRRGLSIDNSEDLPPAFVQGEDDISNDVFFGKRDVQLANRLSAALRVVGYQQPLYVEDRAVWDNLLDPSEPLVPHLRLFQDDDSYDLDVLVIVGLWSNLLATGLAGWGALPEFEMVGDPRQHATRTVRMCTTEGLRIVDLNASPETEELGGNPAILVTRALRDIHLVIAGGATSLSTLRLAELLSNKRVWSELAYTSAVQGPSGEGGSWFAIECPNAAQWRDRCRVVASGTMDEPLDHSIRDLARVDWTTDEEREPT